MNKKKKKSNLEELYESMLKEYDKDHPGMRSLMRQINADKKYANDTPLIPSISYKIIINGKIDALYIISLLNTLSLLPKYWNKFLCLFLKDINIMQVPINESVIVFSIKLFIKIWLLFCKTM